MGKDIKLFGLIGFPLRHSFSKKYFTEKFEKEGLNDCRFELIEIDQISKQVTEVLSENPDLRGFAVTIPYKKQVIPLLHDTTELPLPACNCVKVRHGKLIGYNTDIRGFEQSLLPLLTHAHTPALILGTGGAAEGVKHILAKLNIPFAVASRGRSPDTINYHELSPDFISRHRLIINCTPLGTYPNVNDYPPIPYEGIGAEHYLFDLVYNPAETLFLRMGRERGARIKNGADMLEIQAEANWIIWNSD